MRVVIITKLRDLHYMVTASVRHSQKLSVVAWVAVKQDGIVVCTHCTCMAGLGEACSHIIAALLFTLEANTKMKRMSHAPPYHVPCLWLPPSFQSVPCAELSDVDFATPQERKVDDAKTSTSDSSE